MRYLFLLLLTAVASAQGPKLGRKVVFEDQFNARKLDAAKWNVENPNFVQLQEGKLVLIFQQSVSQSGSYTSSCRLSANLHAQQYGYFEASVRFNESKGHRGIFGFCPADPEQAPAAEAVFLGTGSDDIFPWGRFSGPEGSRDAQLPDRQRILGGGRGHKRFNEYGILWSEKSVAWFLEGKKVMEVERSDSFAPVSVFLAHGDVESDKKHRGIRNFAGENYVAVPVQGYDHVLVDWVKIWK